MAIQSNNGFDVRYSYSPVFQARRKKSSAVQAVTAPIDKVEDIIENTVDKFVPEDKKTEERKKSNRTAIEAGVGLVLLSAFVAILNPKSLTKISEKLKKAAIKAGNKAKTDKTGLGKVYRFGEKAFNEMGEFAQFSNNFNSVKDRFFKWMCTEKKSFSRVKNKSVRNVFQKIDNGFVKIMKRPHEWITNSFEKITRNTVLKRYSRVNSSFDKFNKTIESYRSRLSTGEKAAFDAKMQEIKRMREYFGENNVKLRLKYQETLMKEVEKGTTVKTKQYLKHMFGKGENLTLQKRKKYLRENMYFWAEKILMPARNKLSQGGKRSVDILVGDGTGTKGAYGELLEIVAPHLKKEEKSVLQDSANKLSAKLRNANKTECIKYFNKKRDLTIGSAPTDILTAIIGLAGGSLAIGMADDRDERISRAVTKVIPVIAGLGVAMGMTAMLITGVKGMLTGLASTILLSKTGSYIDKHYIPKSKDYAERKEAYV